MMRRALFHAERALGATVPNPMVGAVVVDRAGIVVGQGFHERAGQPHAEVVALDAAGARAVGATLFVTLEPCCHVGRTGPCTRRILAAGISRVVAATRDPDPRVAGQGVRELREAGVSVDVGLEETAARRLNAAYLMAQEQERPFVAVKAATTRDGRIAARRDRPTAISGPAAARRTQRLRASVDAIAVGAGTVLADDPRLTVRDVVRTRPLTRVVFDQALETPPTARVYARDAGQPVVVFADPAAIAASPERAARFTAAGVDLVPAPTLAAAMRALLARGNHTLLVEGGAALHRSFWQAMLVDRLHLIVAPARLGDAAVALFDGLAVPWTRLSHVTSVPCGLDMWMDADVHWNR
jgi:diaminohydroxyphosphoribosylaminopyrimidine deaminase / 5-amino-6-(5-phosphoribosylamino)uracil reductase